jgi:hypothetical protein
MRRLILLAALVAAASMALASPTPARAATVRSVSFTKHWTFKSEPLGVCLIITETGHFTYTVNAGRFGIVFWRNQRLNDPRLEVDVHTYGRGSCIGPSSLTRISMEQLWSGSSCSFNPSISVSLPWGIAFGGWPDCGSRNRAVHATSYGGSSFYVQHNTGSPTGLGSYTGGSAQSPPCYAVFVAITGFQGPNDSDSCSLTRPGARPAGTTN